MFPSGCQQGFQMIRRSAAEAVAYKAAAERLTELLLEFGTHKSGCDSIRMDAPCSCGWEEVRASFGKYTHESVGRCPH